MRDTKGKVKRDTTNQEPLSLTIKTSKRNIKRIKSKCFFVSKLRKRIVIIL